MIRIFKVLMAIEAARVAGDEGALMVDREPVRIGFEGEARSGVLGRDRIMIGIQSDAKL